MATDRQIAANRANAQKSTGPRTAQGKAASSANATKFGIYSRSPIIPGEDPAELDALRRDYYETFHPANGDERRLLETMISSQWMIYRLNAAFHQKWIKNLEDDLDSPYQRESAPLVRAYNCEEDHFVRLSRMIASFDRSFHRARTALVQAQKDRKRAQPVDPKPAPPQLASFCQKNLSPASAKHPSRPAERHAPARTAQPAARSSHPLTPDLRPLASARSAKRPLRSLPLPIYP